MRSARPLPSPDRRPQRATRPEQWTRASTCIVPVRLTVAGTAPDSRMWSVEFANAEDPGRQSALQIPQSAIGALAFPFHPGRPGRHRNPRRVRRKRVRNVTPKVERGRWKTNCRRRGTERPHLDVRVPTRGRSGAGGRRLCFQSPSFSGPPSGRRGPVGLRRSLPPTRDDCPGRPGPSGPHPQGLWLWRRSRTIVGRNR